MAVSQDDIEKYLRGELSHAQRHALEKEALRDPFLADALAGAEQIGPDAFAEDLAHVQLRMQAKAPRKQTFSLRLAASVVLLLGLATAVYFYFSAPTPPPSLALQPPAQEEPTVAAEGKSAFADSSRQQVAAERPALPARRAEQAAATTTASPEPVTLADAAVQTEKPEEQRDVAQTPAAAEAEPVAPVAVPALQAAELIEQKTKKAAAREEASREQSLLARKQNVGTSAFTAELVTGQVVSAEDGSPLPGVNVVLKGTTLGTVTDGEGRFQLPFIPQGVLVFSFIGLQSVEQPVPTAPVVVKMPMDVSQLSEVVVTGYGVAGDEDREPGPYRTAEPVGGRKAFNQYLEQNVVYPPVAKAKKIEGKVTIQFKVQQNGQLTDFLVIKGIGGGCEEELIRLVKEGPTWTAELNKGQPVANTVRVRFNFRLSDK